MDQCLRWLPLWAIVRLIAAASTERSSFSLYCWHAGPSSVLDRMSLPDSLRRLRIWCSVLQFACTRSRSLPAVVWTRATWIGSCLSSTSAGSIASTARHFRCILPISLQQSIGWWRGSVGRVDCRQRTIGPQCRVKWQLISHLRCREWTRVVPGLILAARRIASVAVRRFDHWSWLIDSDAGWKMRSRLAQIRIHRTILEALLRECRGRQYQRPRSGPAVQGESPEPNRQHPECRRRSSGGWSLWSDPVCRLTEDLETICFPGGIPSAARQQSFQWPWIGRSGLISGGSSGRRRDRGRTLSGFTVFS